MLGRDADARILYLQRNPAARLANRYRNRTARSVVANGIVTKIVQQFFQQAPVPPNWTGTAGNGKRHLFLLRFKAEKLGAFIRHLPQ